MIARKVPSLGLLASTLAFALLGVGCRQEPAANCWDTEYPFDAFPSPPDTEQLVFACKANPTGVGIRADGTVVLLEARSTDFRLDPWAALTTDGAAPTVVPRADLEARRTESAREPAMPWPWDRTLRESLECFARVGTELHTVVPLTAKGREASPGGLRLASWIRAQGARAAANAR